MGALPGTLFSLSSASRNCSTFAASICSPEDREAANRAQEAVAERHSSAGSPMTVNSVRIGFSAP